MRISTLVCACAVAVAAAESVSASGAFAQNSTLGMDGGSGEETKPNRVPATDPAERSARSIECAQKADAQALQGKIRRRFLRQCKSGG